MIELHWLNPDYIEKFWAALAPKIADALAYADDKYALEDVKKEVLENQMQLWVVCRQDNKKVLGVVVTQVLVYPRKNVLVICYAGGKLGGEVARETAAKLGDWAKSKGDIKSIEIWGRPGWERVLGWERIHTVIRKQL